MGSKPIQRHRILFFPRPIPRVRMVLPGGVLAPRPFSPRANDSTSSSKFRATAGFDAMVAEVRHHCMKLSSRASLAVVVVFASRLVSAPIPASHVDDFTGHPRVVVISDIGNEPDDQMSLVRLLLYSNEIDVEALVAATSTWQKTAVHPETMRALIQAYGRVRPNLLQHARGWPTPEEIQDRVFSGQPGYGMAATGLDAMSEGAQAIIRVVDREEARPVWICDLGWRKYAGAGSASRACHAPTRSRREIHRKAQGVLHLGSGRRRALDSPRVSRSVLHRATFHANWRRILLRYVDRHQRRWLLSQWRGS